MGMHLEDRLGALSISCRCDSGYLCVHVDSDSRGLAPLWPILSLAAGRCFRIEEQALLADANLRPPIGYTPLARLKRVIGSAPRATVFAIIEGQDPSYSLKCRIAEAMIGQAERSGLLGPASPVLLASFNLEGP